MQLEVTLILIVCLYVDDLIYISNDEEMFEMFKNSMMTEFEMIDLGWMWYFLGIEVIQRTYGIFISQWKYAQDMLETHFPMKFGILEWSILYVFINTTQYIMQWSLVSSSQKMKRELRLMVPSKGRWWEVLCT